MQGNQKPAKTRHMMSGTVMDNLKDDAEKVDAEKAEAKEQPTVDYLDWRTLPNPTPWQRLQSKRLEEMPIPPRVADSIAPLPSQSLPPPSPGTNDSLKVVNPWRTAVPNKQPDSDSSFLAERGYYRRPHSI